MANAIFCLNGHFIDDLYETLRARGWQEQLEYFARAEEPEAVHASDTAAIAHTVVAQRKEMTRRVFAIFRLAGSFS